jgi:hypothetical protein
MSAARHEAVMENAGHSAAAPGKLDIAVTALDQFTRSGGQ